MKFTRFAVVLCLSLAACSRTSDHQHGIQQLKAKAQAKTPAPAPAPAAPAEAKVSDVKIAAAVVFEGGTTEDSNPLSNTHKAMWRIIVCVPRTGETNLGEVDINFKDLGVPNWNTAMVPADGKGSSKAIELESFTLNYTMSGDIVESGDLAYGETNFVANAVNAKWSLPNANQDLMHFSLEDFGVDLSKGDLMSTSSIIYVSGGQKYYFGRTLYRFTKGDDGKLNTILDCENSDQQQIIQKNLNK